MQDLFIPALALLVPIVILIGLVIYLYRLRKPCSDHEFGAGKGYLLTSGYFTGNTQESTNGITRRIQSDGEYPLYEITYLVDGKYRSGWHSFAPLQAPDGIENGTRVTVSYKKRKPWIFKIEKIDL